MVFRSKSDMKPAPNCKTLSRPSKPNLSQVHPQAKASMILHSVATRSEDITPGLDGSNSSNRLKVEQCCTPQIKWRCPPKIIMNCNWQVAAGNESTETLAQKLRLLEAIYPCHFIPDQSVSVEIEELGYDDKLTPIIPIEEEAEDMSSNLTVPLEILANSLPPTPTPIQGSLASENLNPPSCNIPAIEPSAKQKPLNSILPDICPDVTAAISAALAAIMRSNDKERPIDTDLLVEILSNPKMIEQLIMGSLTNTGKTIVSTVTTPMSTSKQVTASPISRQQIPTSIFGPKELAGPLSGHITKPNTIANTITASMSTSNQVMAPIFGSKQIPTPLSWPKVVTSPVSGLMQVTQPNTVPTLPKTATGTLSKKDMYYYKNLIWEHGGEKQKTKVRNQNNRSENEKLVKKFKPTEMKSQEKNCTFFNSSRGCRNGSNCPYRHDKKFQNLIRKAQSAKRMKL